MKRNYLSVGNQFTDTQERKDKLDKAISKIDWHNKSEGKVEFGFMQGYGLKEFIKAFGNNVDYFGIAPFEDKSQKVPLNGYLFGIRNNYPKGDDVTQIILYAVDNGDDIITPVLVIENPDFDIESEHDKAEEKKMDEWDRLTELGETK